MAFIFNPFTGNFDSVGATGGGEANTASNLGSGDGVFATKVGVDLQFKSIVAGTNITITPSGTELLIDAASSSMNWKTEYRTLSAGEITAGFLTLVQTPSIATEVMLDVKGGGAQFYTDDFIVSGTTLSWSGLGLDGVLVAGDKLRIGYKF